MSVLLDTGVLYAYYDRSDRWHGPSRRLIERERGGLIVPSPVIPEVDHLLGDRLPPEARTAFYRGLTEGYYAVVDLPRDAYARVAALHAQYADLELGFVDCAVLAVAEILELGRIATTDRRDFAAVQVETELILLPETPP